MAEPLSLHQGGGEEEEERREGEEERKAGIEQWLQGRVGGGEPKSLLPRPIQIHQAVPSLQEQEEQEQVFDFIDQIFDDAVFGASEVTEVKRRVDGSEADVEEVTVDKSLTSVVDRFNQVQQKIEDLKNEETLEEQEQSSNDVWRITESKFQDLPPLYR